MKLYKVILRGVHGITGINYHESFVVATDPTTAYKVIRDFLDIKNIGFVNEREMDRIELIADINQYSECKTMLFLPNEVKS